MKCLIFSILFLIPHLSLANESSVQYYTQPLKVKQQVGKNSMTEVGFYRFPVYMKHTHPMEMLNRICDTNNLAEFTNVKNKERLMNVNLASLYGLKVSYDLADDQTVIDLTQVKKPAGESFSEDEVIAMTLECVRLSRGRIVSILVDEKTKKWKAYEKTMRQLKKPIYTAKPVPLKLSKTDRLYHLSYWPYEFREDYSEYAHLASFITYGGDSVDYSGSDTAYNGIGMSETLSVSGEGDEVYEMEMNPLVGYAFLKKNKVLTVTAPATYSYLSKEEGRKFALKLMHQAVQSINLTAKAMGESYKDFQLKIIDSRLSETQRKVIQNKWKKGDLSELK